MSSKKESHTSSEEAAKLTFLHTTRDNLVIERDWAEEMADKYWDETKKYEA